MRWQAPILAEIDSWRRKQGDQPSRPESIRRLVELALASAQPIARLSKKATAKATELAAQAIDRVGDETAPIEEREKRKRRLLKGPPEFREIRDDLPKSKR